MNAARVPIQPSKYRVKEFELDVAWYGRKYPEAVLAVQRGDFDSLLQFHLGCGEAELRSPSALFASPFYAQRSDFASRAPAWGLIEDYLRFGADRALSPHWLFDEEFLRSQDPAIRSAVDVGSITGTFIHFLRAGIQRGLRPHPLFSWWEVARSFADVPVDQLFSKFVDVGHVEGKSAGSLFDLHWYLGRYDDLKAHIGPGMRCESAIQHFCEFGLDEGRLPIPDLDVDHYLRECLKAGALDNVRGFNPVAHFLMHGVKAGLNPNRFFQSSYYLEHNPEVASEIIEHGLLGPFEHFLAIGLKRNYKAAPPLIQMPVDDDAAKSLYEKRARLAADSLRRGGTLELDAPEKPMVSAVVPVFNNFSYTAWLLQQLHAYQKKSPETKLEVIVVDNGSTDLTARLGEWVQGVKLVRLDKPVGYPIACNAGAKVAKGSALVFMNNDVELIDGSFEAVVRALEDESVGAVGGRIIKLNGVLQEAGGIVWRDGSAAGYGRGQDPLAARFMVARDVDYCSGCFLGVDRQVFQQLGGFDEGFSPGYYEETDLCARIWRSGKRVRFEPAVAIHHYEYASFSKGRPETISTALMARNRQLFVDRNKEFLATQPAPDFSRIDSIAFRRGTQVKHAVLIEDFVPSEAIGSGFGRSRDVVDTLLSQGWRVTLWILHKRADIAPYTDGLCETVFQPDYPGELRAYLDAMGSTIDLVWLCRTHNFKTLGPVLDAWRAGQPDVRVVFDTEAVASVRTWLAGALAQGKDVNLSGLSAQLPAGMVAREMVGAEHADTIVAVNEVDREMIANAMKVDTRVLGLRFEADETPATFNERKDLLFCGAVHQVDSPNYDSLVWFCNRVMPLLRKALPALRLRVVGHWRPGIAIPDALISDQVEIVGEVESLRPSFEKARVFISPTRFAAGVPHKVGQSMALGVPTVLTPILAMQLGAMTQGGARPFFEAADFSPEAFAAAVIEAYTNADAWQKVRADAGRAVRHHFGAELFAKTVAELAALPIKVGAGHGQG